MVAIRSAHWFNLSCVLLLFSLWANMENPLVQFYLSIDGVQMATAESDSLGIVEFEFDMPPAFEVGRHTVSVNATGTVEFDLEVGQD